MAQWLIVGLGNPGDQYKHTRHNAGFMALDAIAAQISKGTIADQPVILAKPQTFMNNSGVAVKKLFAKYPIRNTKYVILIHDDIDLPLGTIKVSANRGSAGHKGVDSVIKALGTKDFTRIRLGIQPERGKPKDVEAFVLKNFTKREAPFLKQAIDKSLETIEDIMRN